MAQGIKSLRVVQLGKETVKGTAVAATERILGEAEYDPSGYEIARASSPIGVLTARSGPSVLVKKDVDIRLRSDERFGATYEQIAWWLSLALDQPATSGAGPYTHTFDPGIAALWNPHSATLEARASDDGTNQEDLEFEYFTARRLKLSGEMNGVLKLELDGFARQMTDAAITSLSIPTTLTAMTIAQMKYYINDTLAAADALAPAAGLVSPDIFSFDLDIDVGQAPWHGIHGQPYFNRAQEGPKDFRLGISSLYNPDATAEGGAAERVHAAAMDLRFVTLAFTGPGNLSFYIVVAGEHENGEFMVDGDQDGYDTVDMTIIGQRDPTGAKLVKAELINDDSSAL